MLGAITVNVADVSGVIYEKISFFFFFNHYSSKVEMQRRTPGFTRLSMCVVNKTAAKLTKPAHKQHFESRKHEPPYAPDLKALGSVVRGEAWLTLVQESALCEMVT